MNPDSVHERRPLSRMPVCVLCVLALMSTGAAGFAQVAVKGTVVNRTTGQPAARVALTLITFVGGMSPVEEVYSSADGAFAFEKELSRSTEQPMLGMVRAEYEGVPYSSLIRAGSAGDLTVEVYSVEEEDLPAPDRHVVIFGPEESELVVNELFFFRNESDPPLAFRNPNRGTLRFYLPPEAGGEVSVQATGPAGMPLRSTAERLLAVHPLRTADAFQLAAAILWRQELPTEQSFVSLDHRLCDVGYREGFTVLPNIF